MKNDNANSGPTSGATSAAARPIQPPRSPDEQAKAVADVGVGEAAYLTRQQQLAKQAMSRALSDALALGKQAADPHMLMEQHPWVTLGASTVAGFAAAALLVPSKEQQALKKLAAIERALNPPPPPRPKHDGTDGEAPSGEHGYKTGRQSLARAMMGEVIGALKPAIVSLLTAGVTASAAKTTPEEMQAAQAQAQGGPYA